MTRSSLQSSFHSLSRVIKPEISREPGKPATTALPAVERPTCQSNGSPPDESRTSRLRAENCLLGLVRLLLICCTLSCLAQHSLAQENPTQENATPNAYDTEPQQAPAEVPPVEADLPDPEQLEAAAQSADAEVPWWRPLTALALGVTVVLALMIGLRTHAFIALILGALVISCFVPLDVVGFVKSPEPGVVRADTGNPANIVSRVTSSLGGAVSGIGILIAMAAIIGKCMLVSGAADRIVQASLKVFGEKRAGLAMMISGFVLSVPVFFDTVFYLLVPLARSLFRTTGRNYLLYLAAIAAGGAITHTLVPPTPGPLLVANALGAELGNVMVIGLVVGFPSAIVGLLAAIWLNKVMPIEMRPLAGASDATTEEQEFERLPPLWMSLVPVVLPVLLITIYTVYKALLPEDPSETQTAISGWLALVGNANLAMVLAALFAIYLCWRIQGHSLTQLSAHVEDALLSGGVIILITAAGGAFGGLLGMTEIQVVVKSLFEQQAAGGLVVIFVAFGLAAILKMAQGSSTVAMIISSSLVSSIALPLAKSGQLGFDPAYLVPVIGAGSLMGSWMNDSGFWVFAKMGVLTEGETLRSWTVLLSILSVTGLLMTLALVLAIPFPFGQ